MKALTLFQPWASFLVNTKFPGTNHAIKEWETRGWRPSEIVERQIRREGFLVHAGIRITKTIKKQTAEFPFTEYLPSLGPLPYGKIIGHVRIGRIISTRQWKQENDMAMPEEYYFGDYTNGRWATELVSFTKFSNPIQTPGMLNFWDFTERFCVGCGCTQKNCKACIEKTGSPCHWVGQNLCSACKP